MPETDIVVTGPEDLMKLAAGEPAEVLPEKEETKQDAPDAKPAETAPESETGEQPKEEKGERKGGWQKRIDKLTAEKYRLEQELSDYRSKAAKPPEQAAPPAEPKGKPERASYQSDGEFYEALTDWKYDQRIAQEKQRAEQEEQNQRSRAVLDAHHERITEVKGEIPDWEDVVMASKVGIPQSAAIAIYESEVGPKVMYHLASNQDEAQKLWEMTPARQIAYIERIALKLSPETVPATETPVSKAPPPIKPVGATATRTAADEDSMSDDEWIAKRNKEAKGRRKG